MRRVLSLVWAACLLVACHPSFGVYDLRCEGLVEPLGIDSAEPHFSWKIRSDKPMEQAAYEIEVGPDLWQSGKVESPDQVMVPYDGLPLYSRQQAWWRVRVWDSAGKASAWSPKQRFGIGVLDGLKGDFIGAVPGEGKQPVFRKVFTADKSGEAILHVTSLGYHEVYFNGQKVSGEGPQTVLLPAVSQLDKRSLIVTSGLDLRKGENEIMIYAGSGWYKPKTFGVAYDGPLVKAELDVDGVPFLWTDDSWQGAWSGRKDLGTWEAHRFGGEWIQAAVEPVPPDPGPGNAGARFCQKTAGRQHPGGLWPDRERDAGNSPAPASCRNDGHGHLQRLPPSRRDPGGSDAGPGYLCGFRRGRGPVLQPVQPSPPAVYGP